MLGWLSRLLGRWGAGGRGEDAGLGVDELARRLGLTAGELRSVRAQYRHFSVPKRGGGMRKLAAPSPELRRVQRLILRRVLGRLRAHEAAVGFERGRSFVHHGAFHAGREVVVRIDVRDFFPSTRAARVEAYFRRTGWGRDAAGVLTALCTHKGGLPQGAPTSPRLSNLVNFELDARCQGLADRLGARYSRYADDLTFSFGEDDRERIRYLLFRVREILEACGYRMHMKRKLHIRRRHQRQEVTGLVVNSGRARLPREVRRWLRAVEHRARTGGRVSLTAAELEGWRALARMVEEQGAAGAGEGGDVQG